MSTPFMPMYWGDYFRDTRHLTCEQHGAYLLLLGSMWNAGGSLPDDDRKLARFTGCTASRWAKISDEVLCFFERADGVITHKRLKLELEKAQEKSIKRSHSGIKGAEAKSLKNNNVASANAIANAEPLLKHSSEPEPEEIIDTVVSKSLGPRARAPKPRPSKICPSDWSPSEADLLIGAEAGLSPGEIERQLARFRDHEFRTAKSNWSATFRNWLRNSSEMTHERPRNNRPDPANAGLSVTESRRLGAALAIAQRRAARGGADDDGGGCASADVVPFRGSPFGSACG